MDSIMHMKAKEAEASQVVREAAHQLLAAYREGGAAWQGESVPLDALAAWLGLDVITFHPADQPPGTFGFLDPQERLIWLRRDLSQTLRRFTLAHELGHAVLHRHITPPALAKWPAQASLHARYAAPPLDGSSQEQRAATRDDPCQDSDVRETAVAPIALQSVEDRLGPDISTMTYDP